jgi:hypothetical protein
MVYNKKRPLLSGLPAPEKVENHLDFGESETARCAARLSEPAAEDEIHGIHPVLL